MLTGYCQKHKEILRKTAPERYQNISKNEKTKSVIMLVNISF